MDAALTSMESKDYKRRNRHARGIARYIWAKCRVYSRIRPNYEIRCGVEAGMNNRPKRLWAVRKTSAPSNLAAAATRSTTLLLDGHAALFAVGAPHLHENVSNGNPQQEKLY